MKLEEPEPEQLFVYIQFTFKRFVYKKNSGFNVFSNRMIKKSDNTTILYFDILISSNLQRNTYEIKHFILIILKICLCSSKN